MVLCIDLDGVVFSFNEAYARLLVEVSGEDRFPEGWRDNPDLIAPCWDYDVHFGYSAEARKRAWEEHILPKKKQFWRKLPLMSGAKETIARLNHLSRNGHDIYFLTQRIGDDPKHQTEMALYDNGLIYPTVAICHADNKPTMCRSLGANIFVDDKLPTVENAHAVIGAKTRVYLIDAPYNQSRGPGAYGVAKNLGEVLEVEGLWNKES